MSVRFEMRVDEALMEKMDVKRGGETRAAFIKRLIAAAVSDPPSFAISVDTERVAQAMAAGFGMCPKATCINVGAIGTACPVHPNLRFKAVA